MPEQPAHQRAGWGELVRRFGTSTGTQQFAGMGRVVAPTGMLHRSGIAPSHRGGRQFWDSSRSPLPVLPHPLVGLKGSTPRHSQCFLPGELPHSLYGRWSREGFRPPCMVRPQGAQVPRDHLFLFVKIAVASPQASQNQSAKQLCCFDVNNDRTSHIAGN